MGRRESPVDPGAGPVQRFAYELRKLRREAGGITYREMARRAGYAVTTLSQAAAGDRLASLPVVAAYVKACGGDVAEWELRWRQVAEEILPEASDEDDAGSPYPGLARYETGDSERFFGRDRLVEELLALVRRRRFAALFGPSGSGKSSLLRAGLVAAVRQGRLDEPVRSVQVLTPGRRPMAAHAARLSARQDALWVVDQFEELFTLCRDPAERAEFIDLLLTARDPDSRVRAVIAVRADFYGHCAGHRPLTEALRDANLLVGPMDRDDLREAIVKPAMARGLIVERALTAEVMEDVLGEPGGLPLMSHALLETWRRRQGKMLTLEGYRRAGGVRGAVTATAEEVYSGLSPVQAAHARRILLRLVDPGERDTRRPAAPAELDPDGSPEAARVIRRLADARLLTLHEDSAEIAHEALIASWPRLRGWIEEERDLLRAQRALTEAAATWDELGRDPGALFRGARLAAADRLRSRQAELTPLERDFLTASAGAAARRGRLARAAVAVLVVLSVVASAAAVIAVNVAGTAERERRNAETRRQEVLSRFVTNESEEHSATDPVLAGLLAAAAWRITPTGEARHRMLDTIATSLRHVLAGHTGDGATLFSPDGRLLATADDTTVRLWETASGRLVGAFETGHVRAAAAMAFSPDGRVLLTPGPKGAVLWDTATARPAGPPLTRPGESGPVLAVAFSPDGTTPGDQRREQHGRSVAHGHRPADRRPRPQPHLLPRADGLLPRRQAAGHRQRRPGDAVGHRHRPGGRRAGEARPRLGGRVHAGRAPAGRRRRPRHRFLGRRHPPPAGRPAGRPRHGLGPGVQSQRQDAGRRRPRRRIAAVGRDRPAAGRRPAHRSRRAGQGAEVRPGRRAADHRRAGRERAVLAHRHLRAGRRPGARPQRHHLERRLQPGRQDPGRRRRRPGPAAVGRRHRPPGRGPAHRQHRLRGSGRVQPRRQDPGRRRPGQERAAVGRGQRPPARHAPDRRRRHPVGPRLQPRRHDPGRSVRQRCRVPVGRRHRPPARPPAGRAGRRGHRDRLQPRWPDPGRRDR